MTPIPPFWFKQRQAKAEPTGENQLKLTGPNLPEAFIHVRQDQGKWAAGVRLTPEGTDVAGTEPEFPSPQVAWDAAFELYRRSVII